MRVLICVLLLLGSMASQAVGFESIPIYTPKPVYPERLLGTSGKVKVRFAIQSDGTVSKIKILESTHPRFDVEVIRTLKTWRFRPWSVTGDVSSEIEERAVIVFDGADPSRRVNDELGHWRCSDVNNEVRDSESEFPGKPLSATLFFWASSGHVSKALINAKVPDAERELLINKLKEALPDIAQRCKQNPNAKYQDYLPEEIRRVLVPITVQAGDVQLVYQYAPFAPYPDELRDAGKEGDVLMKFFVQSDGTVTRLQVLESSYPQLAEAVEKTVATWRFKPWGPGDGKPSELEVRAPFIFRMKSGKTARPDSNIVLPEILCREVNKAFSEMDKSAREYPLVKMRIFWHTEQYLNGPVLAGKASTPEIESMVKDFKSALPEILNNCRKNPNTKYADYLPQQVRQFL